VGDPSPKEAPEESERRKVQDFVTSVQLIATELRDQKLDFPASLFCLSALDYLDPTTAFHYKDDANVNWENELRECGERNFFATWRQTVEGGEKEKARGHLSVTFQQYSEAGFAHVLKICLLQLLREHPRTSPTELFQLLQNRSYFYLPLNNLPHAPVRALLYALSDEERLNALFQVNNGMRRLNDEDKFRLSMCQVMWGCPLNDVPLIQLWKRDYEQCDDKGSLHTIEHWQQLPDPLKRKEGEADVTAEREETLL
jgi:hypothetical protein